MQLALKKQARVCVCVRVSLLMWLGEEERQKEGERPPRLLKGLFELALFPEAAKWRQSNVYLTASSLTTRCKTPPSLIPFPQVQKQKKKKQQKIKTL